MRNFILTAAVMVFSMAVIAKAEVFTTPKGVQDALATADYGGVDISTTLLFSAGTDFIGIDGHTLYGVVFSSGSVDDFVTFHDTDVILSGVLPAEKFRLYNVGNPTSSVGSNIGNGFVGTKWPTRFLKGLAWHPNVATYNSITVLYIKHQ